MVHVGTLSFRDRNLKGRYSSILKGPGLGSALILLAEDHTDDRTLEIMAGCAVRGGRYLCHQHGGEPFSQRGRTECAVVEADFQKERQFMPDL